MTFQISHPVCTCIFIGSPYSSHSHFHCLTPVAIHSLFFLIRLYQNYQNWQETNRQSFYQVRVLRHFRHLFSLLACRLNKIEIHSWKVLVLKTKTTSHFARSLVIVQGLDIYQIKFGLLKFGVEPHSVGASSAINITSGNFERVYISSKSPR